MSLPDPYNLERPPLLPTPQRGQTIIDDCEFVRRQYPACFRGPGSNHQLSAAQILLQFRAAHRKANSIRYKVQKLWERVEYSVEYKEEINAHFTKLMRELAEYEKFNRDFLNEDMLLFLDGELDYCTPYRQFDGSPAKA
jgi:hypothetical protein